MSVKNVKCRVLGHSDGPECSDCGTNMDTVEVLEPAEFVPADSEAHYCYNCSNESTS